jgi:hypothetical protein
MGRTSQIPQARPEERLEAENVAVSEERRRRIVGALTAGVLVVALVGGVLIVATAGNEPGTGGTEGPFGTHFAGLEDRRLAAGVPTMSDEGAGGPHIHPELSVYANGKEISIPVNIGIDPSRPPELMAGLHTHDTSGAIHVENAVDPTLGQFFEIWGVPFSADRLGPYGAEGDDRVRVWVDGEPSQEFEDLVLEDGMEVLVSYGTDSEMPLEVAG